MWVPLVQLHPTWAIGHSNWELSLHFGTTDGACKILHCFCWCNKALITTAVGMIVAIPALVFIVISARIIDINAQFETQAGLMIQELYDYR
jgi:hypothetical protein